MLRASQNAAQPEPTRLTAAMRNNTSVRRANGALASASERDSVATTLAPGSSDKVMCRVARSVARASAAGAVLTAVDQALPDWYERVTARPVMSANSVAAFESSSNPMTIHATGRGLRTATDTSW